MNQSLRIPESYKQTATVAIRGMGKIMFISQRVFVIFYIIYCLCFFFSQCFSGNDCDTVICTTDKKLMKFFKGRLTKSCNVEIEANHLEPFVTYEPKLQVYYILHGDNTVVIVKDKGTDLEVWIGYLFLLIFFKKVYIFFFIRVAFRLSQHILMSTKWLLAIIVISECRNFIYGLTTVLNVWIF